MAYNEDAPISASSTPGAVNARVATTGALPASTYNNGVLGVGATLTRNTNGTVGTIDGVSTFVVGDRILLKNEASTLTNGVYEVTTVGDGSNPFVLTRTTDADTQAENDDLIVIPSLGTTNKSIPFGQQTDMPVMGTDPIVFAQTSLYITQRPAGTQNKYQVPVYSGTSRQVTKGTSTFKYEYDTTNKKMTIGGIIRSTGMHNNAESQGSAANQDVRSGTDTPTGTAGSNVTSVTPAASVYSRTGNHVIVTGGVTVDVTTSGAFSFDLSLPINSTFSYATQVGGSGANPSFLITAVSIGMTASNKATFTGSISSLGGSFVISYSYGYEVI